jgi:3-deoxy-D-manno-octulosonic-acid transferase
MFHSAGLALYLLLSRRRAPDHLALALAPPGGGPVVWMQAFDAAGVQAALMLHRSLRASVRATCTVLVCPAELVPQTVPANVMTIPPLPENPDAIGTTLRLWRPEALLLIGGGLPPALVYAAHEAGVPVFVVNGGTPYSVAGGRRLRWWPGLLRALAVRLSRVLASDAAAARAYRRAGVAVDRVEISGALDTSPGALPYTEAEREALAMQLRARPVWLAAAVPVGEELAVLRAHKIALQWSLRLLLVLVPEVSGRGNALAALTSEEGLTVAQRTREDEIEETTQVYIADTEGELGLWYRLASVSYLGGTLQGPGCTRHPFEPAALGSAVVHGPFTGDHAEALARLGTANAARKVRDSADQLAEAVGELLAPDTSAMMAHNAWQAVTTDAEVTDRVVQLLRDLLSKTR